MFKRSSGERYQSVTTLGEYDLKGILKLRDRPKSAIFKFPTRSINRLDGFRSRCNIFCLWQYAIPSNNWCI